MYSDELNHLILKGSAEKPGLAALAMAEIFLAAEKDGNSITLSSYEVYQDNVYDSLDPEHRIVLVQGDAQGKIRLKGLSRVSYLLFVFNLDSKSGVLLYTLHDISVHIFPGSPEIGSRILQFIC